MVSRLPRLVLSLTLFLTLLWASPPAALPLWAESPNASDMLEKAVQSVVNVTVESADKHSRPFGFGDTSGLAGGAMSVLADSVYGRIQDFTAAQTLGSGFVVQEGGKKFVVTNAHVVGQASDLRKDIHVHSITGVEYPVALKGADTFYDIAVLEFLTPPGPELLPIPWREDDPRLGEPVYAIGNPLRLYPYSVTDGIVSGRNRAIGGSLTGRLGFLQTSAMISPGNSGGPLVDAQGRVAGVNSQVESKHGQINLALNGPLARRLTRDIVLQGRVQRAFAGLVLAQQFQRKKFMAGNDLRDRDLPQPGVRIADLLPGSKAEKALAGRIDWSVLSIAGQPVGSLLEAMLRLEELTPGQTIALELERDGKRETVQVGTELLTTQRLGDLGGWFLRRYFRLSAHVDKDRLFVSPCAACPAAPAAGPRFRLAMKLGNATVGSVEAFKGDVLLAAGGDFVSETATFSLRSLEDVGRLAFLSLPDGQVLMEGAYLPKANPKQTENVILDLLFETSPCAAPCGLCVSSCQTLCPTCKPSCSDCMRYLLVGGLQGRECLKQCPACEYALYTKDQRDMEDCLACAKCDDCLECKSCSQSMLCKSCDDCKALQASQGGEAYTLHKLVVH